MRLHSALPLILIILLGLSLRLFTINWDSGYHLHPDERAIILFTLPLQFPLSFETFFSPTSSWNPHFFAYGSFPLYLLKVISSVGGLLSLPVTTYDGIQILGRIISALFDTGTIIVLYFFTKKFFSKNVALLASLFYAISVLPIQLSHFYAVDTLLTFFCIFLLYQLIRFYEYPTKRKAIGIGILFGFALATKTSAFVLFIAIFAAISIDFLYLFLKQPHKPTQWIPHLPLFIRRLCIEGFLICSSTLVVFFIFEPYAFIDFKEFWNQTMQQSAMTKSAFTFPYTLQYVGKIPYLYEIKNILLFGLGPLLGFLTFFGILFYHIHLFQKKRHAWKKESIFLVFFWIYFLLVGSFAIGFMRYMLPLYPFFCFFAALCMYELYRNINKKYPIFAIFIFCMYLFLLFLWPISFLHIYQKEPTRVSASKWITENIPPGKTLAIEHWDDALPLFGIEKYTIETLELYNPDSEMKWDTIQLQLQKSDYIIIASNRLYVPLSKLTNCKIVPALYCYPRTAQYYKDLFNEKLGFKKVAEFTLYPKIPLINISLDDSTADESFTVYDHPKIMIYKKLGK